jgi:multidrug efflux pump subunit AcrA (membrane-fusion protein)
MTMGRRKLGRIPKHHKLVKRPRPGSGTADACRLAGIALIALLLGLTACDRSPEVRAAPKPPSVTVVAAAQRSVPVCGQYVGQTEAVKTVEVRARVEGFIERQVAPDGADVKAGDLLFTIDPRPLEAALRQAEANVARDTAALHQAEAALDQREAEARRADHASQAG